MLSNLLLQRDNLFWPGLLMSFGQFAFSVFEKLCAPSLSGTSPLCYHWNAGNHDRGTGF